MVKSNKFFIIMMILSYLFAYLQGGNLPYTIFYGFLFIFLLSIINLYKQNKNIKAKVVCNKEVYNSKELDEFSIIISNLGILPSSTIVVKSKAISEIDSKYNGDALILMGDDQKSIKTKVRFKHRGIYDFGNITLESSDLFHVFMQTRVIKSKKVIRVYPKIYNLENIFSRSKDIFKNAQSKKSRIEDLYSICDVRKYREGDNFKRIHWKLSAKCGELFVRNLDTVSGEESNIFLNMNIENMDLEKDGIAEEDMVDLCVSLVKHMEIKGVNSKVFINSSLARVFDIKNKEDVVELMEFFLKEKSEGTDDFLNFINSNINRIPKLSFVMIIVGTIDEKLKNNLIKMKDIGYNLAVFYFVEGIKQIEHITVLKKIGVDCKKIDAILNKSGE